MPIRTPTAVENARKTTTMPIRTPTAVENARKKLATVKIGPLLNNIGRYVLTPVVITVVSNLVIRAITDRKK